MEEKEKNTLPEEAQAETGNPPVETSTKRLQAENDVFHRALQLLQSELGEIEKEYGKDPNAPDAVKALSNEVSILKSNIEEIKNYLAQLTSAGQRSPQQNQWGQMPLTVFPQNTAGLLPYISTPNIPPIMPQINNNNRSF
jgi:predicted RNase H-like nuclease (RuvC/YqgF family)